LLVSHFLLGKTQAQLAAESGQSASTISRRMQHALVELRQHLRLKGVYALPAVLAGLLINATARQAPAALVQELGKMTMLSGASSACRAAKFGASADPLRYPPAGKSLLRSISTPVGLALVGMLGLFLLLQLANSWRSAHTPVDPETSSPLLSHGSTIYVPQPQISAPSQKAPAQ
jgi:hypothetical protein